MKNKISVFSRKILPLLIFIFITFITFNTLYTNKSHKEYTKLQKLESNLNSYNITISTKKTNAKSIYDILTHYLDKYNGNIYLSEIVHKDNKIIYTNYVYFNNEDIFKNVNLTTGRNLKTSEKESNLFMSTNKTSDNNQIGLISDFDGKNNFEIHTLKSRLDISIFQRNFVIQLENESILSKLSSDLEHEGIFIQKTIENSNSDISYSTFILMLIGCFLSLILIIFNDLLNLYRNIGIEKLLGYSLFTIWRKYAVPIIFMEVISIVLTTLILIKVNFKVFNKLFWLFSLELFIIYIGVILFTILIISIPYIYVKRISLSNIIKNKRPVKATIRINNIIKVVLFTLIVIISIKTINNFKLISSVNKNSYSQWEKTKNYAVLPNFITTDNKMTSFSQEEIKKERSLYLYFNKKGAILADFDSCVPDNRKANAAKHNNDYELDDITINPNYLKSHTIYDIEGNVVDISEDTVDSVLLVPDKYHDYEKEIRDYYNDVKYEPCDNEKCTHKTVNGDINLADQKQKIIWIKSNQKFFSYLLAVNPLQGNCVVDPIARVLTESNGKLNRYYTIIGFHNSPFKIKVDNPLNPKEFILPKLKEYYNMELYNFPIEIVYDRVETEISNLKDQLKIINLAFLILIIMISIITYQNLSLYFEQNKIKLIIQKLHGYKMKDKYKSYFYSTLICWMCILIISNLVCRDFKVIFIVLSLMIIELILTLIMIYKLEKKNILRFTKGG